MNYSLRPNQISTLRVALSRQKALNLEQMGSAAEREDVQKLRAHLSEYDVCSELMNLLKSDRIVISVETSE